MLLGKRVNNMYRILALIIFALVGLTACATVPMGDRNQDDSLKAFIPKSNVAGVYIFRDYRGPLDKMSLDVDGQPLGETAAKTYVYVELMPGEHVITSKSENSSSLRIRVAAGRLYFIWQKVRMGVMYARTELQVVREDEGKEAVRAARLAIRKK